MNRKWMILLVAGSALGAAQGEDLQSVYDHALIADPTIQQAAALHMATREVRTQAILDMLPLNANASKNWSGTASNSGTTSSTSYSSPVLGNLALQVNLFSWGNWVALKSANHTVAQGEANYLAAQQDLIARVAQQYFNVLGAADTLAAQESALQSATRQLEQAERRYEVGLIAVTRISLPSGRPCSESTNGSVSLAL